MFLVIYLSHCLKWWLEVTEQNLESESNKYLVDKNITCVITCLVSK